jgi:hypothetical protein
LLAIDVDLAVLADGVPFGDDIDVGSGVGEVVTAGEQMERLSLRRLLRRVGLERTAPPASAIEPFADLLSALSPFVIGCRNCDGGCLGGVGWPGLDADAVRSLFARQAADDQQVLV